METRTLRRHGVFLLALLFFAWASVDLIQRGVDASPHGGVRVLIGAALVLGLLGAFYASQKWRRICEIIGVLLALAALAWLFGRA